MPSIPLSKRLADLDIPEREAKVYTALLELEGSGVAEIAKKAGIQRTYVYDILESLRKKGLASWYLKHGKKTYQAESPRALQHMFEERLERFSDLLPELISLCGNGTSKPRVRFYEGKQGALAAYEELLAEEGYDNLCEPEAVLMALGEEQIMAIGTTVSTRNLKVRELFTRPKGPLPPHNAGYQAPRQETRFLAASSDIRIPTDLCICATKAYLITFDTEIHTVIIESSGIVSTLRALFELLWQAAA